jgi:hypothetical protein
MIRTGIAAFKPVEDAGLTSAGREPESAFAVARTTIALRRSHIPNRGPDDTRPAG